MTTRERATAWRGPGLSRTEAATYLGVCVRTLDEHRARGTGPGYWRIGSRVVYWPAQLDAFVEGTQHAKATRQLPERAPAAAPSPSRLYTVAETSALLGVSARTLAYWRVHTAGPAWTRQGKTVLYRGSDLVGYLGVQ